MRKTLIASVMMLICTLAAMADSPSSQGGKAMSPFKFKAEQPQSLPWQSNITSFRDLTSEKDEERLLRKGIIVNNSFDMPKTENVRIASVKAPLREGAQNYTLTVNLKYDKSEIWSFDGMAFPNYAEGRWFLNEWPEEESPNELLFNLPEGSYDIEILLTTENFDFYLLTASEVNVTADTEITLDTADAVVEIAWQPLLPDGSAPVRDIVVVDPDTFEVIDEIEGTVLNVTSTLEFSNRKHNTVALRGFNPSAYMVDDVKYESGNGTIKAIPNENYRFYFVSRAIGYDGGYLIPISAEATASCIVSNDIDNYVTLKPEYAFTPYQPDPQIFEDENGGEIVFDFDKNQSLCLSYFAIREGLIKGNFQMGLSVIGEELKKWIHVCQDPNNIGNFEIMPKPCLIEDWSSVMNGAPIDMAIESPVVSVLNNTSSYINNYYLKLPNDRNVYMSEVVNPWLSFDLEKPHVWNYGCPVLVFSVSATPWESNYNFAYIGRLGENRAVDLLSTIASVAVNDAAPSDEVFENLQYGQLPDSGKIDFEFTNTNVEIDGIPGKNVSRVGFDMSCADWQPPTLQIVRFSDKDGNFTDRYANGEDGIIEFYGGDFVHVYNRLTNNQWYTEEPAAEVKVEYAPYGTDSFLPLEVENIPERDFMPGFGTYYRGSLAAVDRKSETGWFDVRITLTDAAGNFQEQTLSPAFKIDSSVGVETIASPEIAVSVANGNITVCGCENPLIEVYTPDGILLSRSASSSISATEFAHGIYLISVTDGTRRVLRKIRL